MYDYVMSRKLRIGIVVLMIGAILLAASLLMSNSDPLVPVLGILGAFFVGLGLTLLQLRLIEKMRDDHLP